MAIALPWFAWMTLLHGRPFVDFALGQEVLARYALSPEQFSTQRRPFFWYFQVYPGDAAPWTLFTLAAMAWTLLRFRSFDPRTRNAVALLVIWFFAVVVLFSTSRFKATHYILPAYPAAALLTGFFIDRACTAAADVPRWLWRITFALTALVALVGGVMLALYLHRVFDTPWTGASMLTSVLLSGTAIAALGAMRASRRAALSTLVGGLAAAIGTLALFTAPQELQRYQPTRQLGARIAAIAGPGDAVALYGRWGGPGLIFYSQRDITWVDTPKQASDFLEGGGRRFCVMPQSEFEALSQTYQGPLCVLARASFVNIRLRRLLEPRPRADERVMLLVVNQPASGGAVCNADPLVTNRR
jgi:4-amino-4-deoxy-L-arabinose transferase-like glycosyltransferase